ncbi:MAG: hypothetical protein R3C16_06580 [Hyphomonadaceae bacterium]
MILLLCCLRSPAWAGARTNASGRYSYFAREACDDGWTAEEVTRLETIVAERAKTIISTSRD